MKNNDYQKILDFSSRQAVPVKYIIDFINHEPAGLAKSIIHEIRKEKIDALIIKPKKDDEDLKKALDFLKKIQKYYPKPNRKLDQFTASLETTAKRASLMSSFYDLDGKRILFLGDDDFTSLASSKISSPASVIVLDLDQRIVHSIKNISNQNKFNINSFQYDARENLPEKFAQKFDVVFTDPPYTQNGFNLFLSRAIDALDLRNKSARIYICFGNSDRARERFLPIYDILQKSGLMIRFIFDKFNFYKGADSIGNTSSLFVCDVTPQTKSLIKANLKKDDIYTG